MFENTPLAAQKRSRLTCQKEFIKSEIVKGGDNPFKVVRNMNQLIVAE